MGKVGKTLAERKAALVARKAALEAKLNALKSREGAEARKMETRQKVLIGAILLSYVRDKQQAPTRNALIRMIEAAKLHDRDRAALAPLIAELRSLDANAPTPAPLPRGLGDGNASREEV
uniref:hypothetical protein n=1 Tax=Magnetospirillum sp. ME-1 TaxID=1639348 RepID=UPI001446BD2A|nr:hypothetical protein [Magnetospirillum sp. ME-1]